MLSWLKGGPVQTDTAPSASAKDLESPSDTPTPLQEIGGGSDSSSSDEDDVAMPPQTPPAMFALKAFRTTLFGTPAPPKFQERPPHKRKASKSDTEFTREEKDVEPFAKEPPPTSRRNSEQLGTSYDPSAPSTSGNSVQPIPFKITKKLNLFDPSSTATSELPAVLATTPVKRPVSPTKGILLTPGTAMARKKAVTFHPSVPTATTPPIRNGHIRSGLPHEFPGKFPSPWTPKVSTASHHQRSASWSDPTSSRLLDGDEVGPVDKGKQAELPALNSTRYDEVNEDSRISDFLDESDGDDESPRVPTESDGTIDMNAPRSNSGKYWKDRTEEIEGLALTKVDKLRSRCKIAIRYAKQKDEVCVNLGERIREVNEKNKRLKAELKRLSGSAAGAPSTATGYNNTSAYSSHALEQAMHIIEEKDAQLAAKEQGRASMEAAIERHKERLQVLEEMLDQRESKIAELSMNVFGGGEEGEDLEEVVMDLRRKLRSAKLEAKEYGLVRLEAKNLRERVDSLEKGYSDVTTENERLQRELERPKAYEDEKSINRIRSTIENRLKAQVEGLEKAKKDLRAEMRDKSLNEAKERREAERKWRGEVADAKGVAAAAEWEKEKLDKEVKELKEYTGRLEKELERTKLENDELKKAASSSSMLGDEDIREWQTTQRTTAQELRKVKEENSRLKTQKDGIEEQLKDSRKEIVSLTHQLNGTNKIGVSALPTIPNRGNKEPESTSDDSAVDHSFDQRNQLTTSPFPVPSTPRGGSPLKCGIPSPKLPKFPSLETPRLASKSPGFGENSEQSPILLPDLPPDTPAGNDYSSFYHHRRQRASPRASIVNLAPTPPGSGSTRKVAGVGNVVSRRASGGGGRASISGGATGFSGAGGARRVSALAMDPERKAAAEKRLAERKRMRGAANKVSGDA